MVKSLPRAVKKVILTREEKEKCVLDEVLFFVEKLERKYGIIINCDLDFE